VTSAREHFERAKARAIEYVDMGDGASALSSLVSDLNKHDGTSSILNDGLLMLFTGEVMLAGADGARRFIDGLPGPAVES
jgi:hypothetical protein